jgi:crossover junction endodeoxyribonuclease RusA
MFKNQALPEVLFCIRTHSMTSKSLVLHVPFPPSVNTYWGFHGSHRFLTTKAKEFKTNCLRSFIASKHQGFGASRLQVCVELYAPDRRKRDIDNHVKSLLDALCQANVFDDDSQIDHLTIVRKKLWKNGLCLVRIDPYACEDSITEA